LLPGGDARQPVLVDADKLEWFDRERKAVYSGSVLAQQGESSLKASRLTIFMTEQGKSAKSDLSRPTAGESASPTPGQGEIERMEADGPVELIQKDQTATGDKGEYDHAANTVTLIGHVTLRQGGNVTTGTRLVYDIDTRQAQVSNPKGMFAPRAAQPEASGAPLAQPAR
jgi:lipopolysaccharide export system protein LptA